MLGVDQSRQLLTFAEDTRGGLPRDRLRYNRQDLRHPLKDDGFDAAINIFSSLGYGSEADDLAILTNISLALKPGGHFFLETNHRDAAVLTLSRIDTPACRLPDGTLIIEEPKLDILTGRDESRWFWSGSQGQGEKPASLRVYSATELISLLDRAGFRLLSAHQGCSTKPFPSEHKNIGTRLGLLCERLV